jgi:hypothetical protein
MDLLTKAVVAGVFVLTAWLFVGSEVSASSTFISSTITEIGPDGRQVTIRTMQGESFSLDVASPEVMKGVRKGDQVSLELDAEDRVNKIVKVGGEAERPKPRMPSDEY